MAKGQWHFTDEGAARELYAVFMRDAKPTRKYPKRKLLPHLAKPSVYTDFLKLCCEFDASQDMAEFRKGMLHVLKSQKVANASRDSGLSRVSLYRMLSKGGNPRLKNFVKVLNSLGLYLWVVDHDFMRRRHFSRPKDQVKDYAPFVDKGRHRGRRLR